MALGVTFPKNEDVVAFERKNEMLVLLVSKSGKYKKELGNYAGYWLRKMYWKDLHCRGMQISRNALTHVVPRWVFLYVGNKTFDFSSKKKVFFVRKRPNLAQNWHFWSIWARLCRLIRCPVGGLVGGYGARAVFRKTPIYFIKMQIELQMWHSKLFWLFSFH